jgi:hypothetical protein
VRADRREQTDDGSGCGADGDLVEQRPVEREHEAAA